MPAVRQKTKASGKESRVIYCSMPDCKFSAKSSSNFQIHMNRHYGLKPYRCEDNCDFVSADPAALIKHRMRLHGYIPRSPSTKKTKRTGPPYSKDSSRARVKVVKVQLESDAEDVSQLDPATTPPSTITLDDLRAYDVVDVDAHDKPYFADAYDLRSDPHPDPKELFPAIRSGHPLEDQAAFPVATLFNALPSTPSFPLANFPHENASHVELSSSEPSLTLDSFLRMIDFMDFDSSLTTEFGTDGAASAASLQSIYPAPLTAWQGNTGAYAENVVPFSPEPETRLTDISTHESYDVPSIDSDVALSTFLDSLELESESPTSYQVPSPSILSDYFNSTSYQSSDFGVSAFDFGGQFMGASTV
ncbi:hypothetical protein DFS33DRAFT_1488461 [Desarmillaria ectypa]|nr:hypothetical protein DFS33DRAFT_1488461 [Desarmillaria ectypa]